MLDQLSEQHQASRSQFDQLMKIDGLIRATRNELLELSRMGDLVTPEDVIKGAGELVAKGASPAELAKLLSDLPEQGPAIQAWLQSNEEMLGEKESQLAPVLEAARHELGMNAMRLIAGHHFGPGEASPAPANSLTQPSAPVPAPMGAPNAS